MAGSLTEQSKKPRPQRPRCFLCRRRGAAGWVDPRGYLTAVCRAHQRFAVAACASGDATFVRLSDFARNHRSPEK